MASGVVVCRVGEGSACVDQWLNATKEGAVHKEAMGAVVGKVLVVAYDALKPYVLSHGYGPNANLSGYLGDLWTIFERTLQFRSVYTRASGIAARDMLLSGAADVYLSATVVTTEEDDHFDHTQPVVTHWYHLFMRKGVPQVSADSYVRAMSSTMWVMTFVAVLLLCLVLWTMARLRCAAGLGSGVEPANSSLGHCLLSVLGCVCSQGWQENPRCLSIRLVVVTTLLFGYLMSNSYSAVLISYLASGHSMAPFSSLDDVAEKGTHALCVRNESYAYLTLKRNPKLRDILNKGVCRDASRADRLVDAVCDSAAVALEIPSVMAASMATRPDCKGKVLRVRNRMQRGTASLLLRPGFPYTAALDYIITRCRSTGVLDRLEKTYLDGPMGRSSSGQDFDDTSVAAGVEVTLEHVRWVLAAYACCLCVPLLLLAAECVVAWKARASRVRVARRTRPQRSRNRVRVDVKKSAAVNYNYYN